MITKSWRCTCGGGIALQRTQPLFARVDEASYMCESCCAMYVIQDLRCTKGGKSNSSIPGAGIIVGKNK